MYLELIHHGFSRDAGYNKPLVIALERNGEIFKYQTSYFFNECHPEYFNVSEAEAALWGIGDAITFGSSEKAYCGGTNVAIFGMNMLSGLAEGISAFFSGNRFDKSSFSRYQYVDYDKCTWESEQRKAIAMQRFENTYVNSQWFSLVTPSGVRLVGQKFLRNYARKSFRGSRLAMASTDAILEGVETSFWTYGTSAPELTLQARLNEVRTMAPYGVGLGFVSGLVFANAKIVSGR